MRKECNSGATNVTKQRKAACYTEDEVAKAIGMNIDLYRIYERGDEEIPYNVLEKLSILFGCDMYSFFEDTNTSATKTDMFAIDLEGMGKEDIAEILRFKDIVLSYLKMEAIERI